MKKQRDPLKQIEESLKVFWKENGNASVIAAKHSEFMIEPKILFGDQLNPEILKMLVVNYLAHAVKQDSGVGKNIEVTPEKLIIKTPKGTPVVIVSDKRLIEQYLTLKQRESA